MGGSVKCSVCGSGPLTDGKTVFRNNPKDDEPDWRCEAHLDPERRKRLGETISLTSVIEAGQDKTRH